MCVRAPGVCVRACLPARFACLRPLIRSSVVAVGGLGEWVCVGRGVDEVDWVLEASGSELQEVGRDLQFLN